MGCTCIFEIARVTERKEAAAPPSPARTGARPQKISLRARDRETFRVELDRPPHYSTSVPGLSTDKTCPHSDMAPQVVPPSPDFDWKNVSAPLLAHLPTSPPQPPARPRIDQQSASCAATSAPGAKQTLRLHSSSPPEAPSRAQHRQRQSLDGCSPAQLRAAAGCLLPAGSRRAGATPVSRTTSLRLSVPTVLPRDRLRHTDRASHTHSA